MTRTRTALLALAGLAVAAAVTTTALAAHPAASSTPTVDPHRVDLHLPVTPPPAEPAPAVGVGTDLPAGTPAMDNDPAPAHTATGPTSAPRTPAPAAPATTPAAVATRPDAVTPSPAVLGQPRPTGALSCHGTETWDGTQCVQPQLTEEVIGRALTCDDGQTGYVIDADLDTNCSLPAPRPNPVG